MTGALTTGGLLAGSGISAAAGIASNIGSNVANKNIQQMNNEFNERMLQKQMDYNTKMYRTQLSDSLKYSDPSFIRNRLEGAGYNAGVLAAGGNLGSATSVPQAQGISPQPAAQRVANFQGIGDAIGNAIDIFSRANLSSAQANNMRIEGKFIAQKAIAELNKTLSETRNNEARTATEDLLRGIRRDVLASEVNLNREQAQKAMMETRGQILQNVRTSVELSFLPDQLKMSLAMGAADIAVKRQQERLTAKQVDHEAEKLAETIARRMNTEQSTQNLRTQNMIQGQQYRFEQQTFNNRVRMLREEIKKLISEQNLPRGFIQWFIPPEHMYQNYTGID